MKKEWMWGIAASVAGAVVMLALTQFLADNKAGSDAVTEAQIKTLIQSELVKAQTVDINGETFTYGQALSKIDHNLTVIQEALADLSED